MCIRDSILAKHHLVKRNQPVNIKCATADKRNININLSITIKVKIKNLTWMFTMLVCKELGPDLILGADFISKTGMILDLYDQVYYFRFDRTRKYRFDSNEEKYGSSTAHVIHQDSDLSHLERRDRVRILKLIKEFSSVLTPKLGPVSYTHLDVYKRQAFLC